MGNYISYPFLSKLCVGREGETEKKKKRIKFIADISQLNVFQPSFLSQIL